MVVASRYETSEKWHDDPGTVRRFVTDLVIDEMRRLRPGGAALPPAPWASDLSVDDQGIGLDSLERLTVASALSDALHLHETERDNLLLTERRFGDWLEIARTCLRQYDTNVTFRSSGSSGLPKRCTHPRVELEQEVDYLAGVFSGARRVLSAVPCHHIYGFLFSILLPMRLRCEVVDVGHMNMRSLLQDLQPGDLLVSHPDHWAVLARHVEAFPKNVAGVTSTAPCPEALARDLQRHGLARLVQVYGSSETGGVGWRETPDGPYQLMPFWSRDAAVQSRILRRSPGGADQSFTLQDRLEWHGDRAFTILGRLDTAVQVGGTNVYPDRVRRALLDHPLVAESNVRLMTPKEGTRLKAFVVPVSGADPATLSDDLMRWSSTRLSAAERPKAFTIGATLPTDDLGKLKDWPIKRD